jgi:hypothetical protein
MGKQNLLFMQFMLFVVGSRDLKIFLACIDKCMDIQKRPQVMLDFGHSLCDVGN